MKNVKKLNLNELKVESFVTSLEGKDIQTVKGGSSVACSGSLASAVVAGMAAGFLVGLAVTAEKGLAPGIRTVSSDRTKY